MSKDREDPAQLSPEGTQPTQHQGSKDENFEILCIVIFKNKYKLDNAQQTVS